MSLHEIKRRADVYISTSQDIKSTETTGAELRQAVDESVAAFMDGGDLHSIPDHQPEPERVQEVSNGDGLPETVTDFGVDYTVADYEILQTVFTRMAAKKFTSQKGKAQTKWVPYVPGHDDPNATKKKGEVISWCELGKQISAIVPKDQRPTDGNAIDIPPIRGYYINVPWFDENDQQQKQKSVWVKFEAAQ
jgi:hypothetical protein